MPSQRGVDVEVHCTPLAGIPLEESDVVHSVRPFEEVEFGLVEHGG